ncbi:MAG: glutamyl-tRNA reductase [Acidobacteriota bacterium]|nr:glutamyl-tRNA reductase [Acidobacteriota bacterium]
MSQLFLLGINHDTAPVDLRERLNFSEGDLSETLVALSTRPGCGEAVVLSTCNRVELYVRCDDLDEARTELTRFLSDFHGVDPAALAPHLYGLASSEAALHLFRVAAGLDSLVVGEPQILGQVKEAYTTASEIGCTGSLLNKLFHCSFAAGKRVRSETELGEGAVSISYAAVALARKIFGSLADHNVLLVGAGEMSELTAVHLKAQQVSRIVVINRTVAQAENLAEKIGGEAIPWTEIQQVLATTDVVVTATGSPTPIITSNQVEAVMRTRRNRPLFIMDIAVPRDVEASAGTIEQVFLYNIDDLQAIVSENLARRSAQITKAEVIVAEEVNGFMTWLRSRRAVPTLVALRQRFEVIRQAELKRLESKLASLAPADRARVEDVTRLIVEKLLSTPTERLKELSNAETVRMYGDALNQLFDLESSQVLIEQPDDQVVASRKSSVQKTSVPS